MDFFSYDVLCVVLQFVIIFGSSFLLAYKYGTNGFVFGTMGWLTTLGLLMVIIGEDAEIKILGIIILLFFMPWFIVSILFIIKSKKSDSTQDEDRSQ